MTAAERARSLTDIQKKQLAPGFGHSLHLRIGNRLVPLWVSKDDEVEVIREDIILTIALAIKEAEEVAASVALEGPVPVPVDPESLRKLRSYTDRYQHKKFCQWVKKLFDTLAFYQRLVGDLGQDNMDNVRSWHAGFIEGWKMAQHAIADHLELELRRVVAEIEDEMAFDDSDDVQLDEQHDAVTIAEMRQIVHSAYNVPMPEKVNA
jgi:hypothetical protein